MKNVISKIGINESIGVQNEFEKNRNIYTAVVDGKSIQSWITFLDKMIEKFKLPMKEHRNVNAYLDWMRDLEWLDSEGYILFIENYADFMKENLEMKKNIIDDFENYILPFWDSEVVQVMTGGKIKMFNVYLVE